MVTKDKITKTESDGGNVTQPFNCETITKVSFSYKQNVEGGLVQADADFIKAMQCCAAPERCVMLEVMKKTNRNILKSLLNVGLWSTLHKWLLEARAGIDVPLLMRIMHVYRMLPVNKDFLKNNTSLHVLRQFTKSPNHDISSLSRLLIDEWDEIGRDPGKTSVKENIPAAGFASESSLPAEQGTQSKIKRTAKTCNVNFRSHGFELETAENPKVRGRPVKRKVERAVRSAVGDGRNGTPGVDGSPPKKELASFNLFEAIDNNEASVCGKNKKTSPSKWSSELAESLKSVSCARVSASSQNELNDYGEEEERPSKRRKLDASSRGAKKSVRWRPDSKLCEYSYFELIPGERGNAGPDEVCCSAIESVPPVVADVAPASASESCENFRPWRCIPIEASSTLADMPLPGCASVEKVTQAERESRTLSAVYFGRWSLPDSPGEPDEEIAELSPVKCRIIPLNEIGNNANCKLIGQDGIASGANVENTNSNEDLPKLLSEQLQQNILTNGPNAADSPVQCAQNHVVNPKPKNHPEVAKKLFRPKRNDSKKQICRYFVNGKCRFGDVCWNIHQQS